MNISTLLYFMSEQCAIFVSRKQVGNPIKHTMKMNTSVTSVKASKKYVSDDRGLIFSLMAKEDN